MIPDATVTINTNGNNLRELVNLDVINKIEGIHISNHHLFLYINLVSFFVY